MTHSFEYDAAIIGGGSGGYAAARCAAAAGLRTAVIEGGAEVGGLCILRGCMPSKTLLESAHRADSIRRAKEFGLKGNYDGPDALEIRERKRRLIAEFANYRQEQLESGKFDFIRGMAKFTNDQTLEVAGMDGGTRVIRGRSFLIATGSQMNWVDVP